MSSRKYKRSSFRKIYLIYVNVSGKSNYLYFNNVGKREAVDMNTKRMFIWFVLEYYISLEKLANLQMETIQLWQLYLFCVSKNNNDSYFRTFTSWKNLLQIAEK